MNHDTERRWRLILGEAADSAIACPLNQTDARMDTALSMLYDREKQGGLRASAPKVSRWLGDIREFFPASVVKVMQQDAVNRLRIASLLLEKEMLESVEPDVHLVATLMSLSSVISDKTKATARLVVQKVVDELLAKLSAPMQQAVTGALHRAFRHHRPRRINEIDWRKTIEQNLKHYQPRLKTIIPDRFTGFGRKRKSLKDVILCIDQSGSMGTSVVYSGIFGAVMASLPAVRTSMVVFDTQVVDLTPVLQDPVELLFGVQLGGGTDIHKAVSYCAQLVTRPEDTVMILITDLYEGGNEVELRQKITHLVAIGVQLIVLLALNDEGAPSYDHAHAQFLADLGIAVFACTPDQFPALMAAALSRQDIGLWAANQNIALKKG